ncbi:unnamed protein product [Heligmosomoides polygyrus]|uniref:Uncharacterized protein n=1 Tax=Heligmosomoides polygyrus TaxID=6339 RepID=A0A183FPD5_HELPZ|nr:unnamed protein product [Heligmosomoides polygyrus]
MAAPQPAERGRCRCWQSHVIDCRYTEIDDKSTPLQTPSNPQLSWESSVSANLVNQCSSQNPHIPKKDRFMHVHRHSSATHT